MAPFGATLVAVGKLGPFLLVILTFTFCYGFVPNTRVQASSALVRGHDRRHPVDDHRQALRVLRRLLGAVQRDLLRLRHRRRRADLGLFVVADPAARR
jgi:hypothetical protein